MEPTGEILCEQQAANAPEFGKNIAVDKSKILDLTIETGEDAELRLCASISLYLELLISECFITHSTLNSTYLTLVIDLLGNLALQNLGGLGTLKYLILTKSQKALQNELAHGEANEDVLPREERPVEKTRELLEVQLLGNGFKRGPL